LRGQESAIAGRPGQKVRRDLDEAGLRELGEFNVIAYECPAATG
jgi:hypothetical protein